jgi:hypothetical protein
MSPLAQSEFKNDPECADSKEREYCRSGLEYAGAVSVLGSAGVFNSTGLNL